MLIYIYIDEKYTIEKNNLLFGAVKESEDDTGKRITFFSSLCLLTMINYL